MTLDIDKPIFIVGVPRSGTTLLYDMMACHKELAFFSQISLRDILSDEFMEFVYLRRRLFEIRRWPFSRDGFEVRVTTSFEMPHEFGLFWNKWIEKSWAQAHDVTDSACEGLRNMVGNLLTKKGKKRFLNKEPSHSIRIEYLNKIFPGAIFINIIRHGIPTVASMTRDSRLFNFPDGYFGLSLKNDNQMNFDLFERHARQWIEVNEEIQRAKNNLKKDQYYEIKYEDFTSHPKQSINDIFKFCQLDNYDIFDKGFVRITDRGVIESISENLSSSNNKYKEELTEEQIQRLNEIMHDSLIRFEYADFDSIPS